MTQETYFTISMVLEVVMAVITVAMGIGLYWVGSKTSEIGEKANKIDTLESRLASSQEKLIEQRVASHATELKQAVNHLGDQVQRLNQRMDQGDGEFDQIGQRNQAIELTVATKFGEFKYWMLENFCLRKDLKEHEASMDRHVQEINQHLSEQDRLSALAKQDLDRMKH